jgi:hypothetical protein
MQPIVRYLGGTGLALWGLVLALEPDVGFRAPWPWMALFWGLQIGTGLAVLQSLLYLFSRAGRSSRWPLWSLVLGSGAAGALVLTPVYWLIGEGLMQQWLGFPATPDDGAAPAGPTIRFGLVALGRELTDIALPVIAAWVLISWPRLQRLVPPLVAPETRHPDADPDPRPAQGPTAAALPAPAGTPGAAADGHRAPWRAVLPRQLGDDLIAVKSELQYLRVWTTRGSALVLGSLQDVEEGEGDAGLRVHRSWWVHARHVRCVRRRGDGAVCELIDGAVVPVSRRRKAEALSRFGDGARYDERPAGRTEPPGSEAQNVRRSPT